MTNSYVKEWTMQRIVIMHFKLFLLFAFIFGGVNLHAQYVPQTWGSGVAMGSNQMQCAHEYKTAEMIVAGDKDIRKDKKRISKLKKDLRDTKREVTKLKRDMARNKRALNKSFNRNIANLLMDHLEEGRSPNSYKSCSATNSSCSNLVDNSRYEDLPGTGQAPVVGDVDQGDMLEEYQKCESNNKKQKEIELCKQQVTQKYNQTTNRTVEVSGKRLVKDFQRASSTQDPNSADQAILNFLRGKNSSGSNGVGNYDTPAEMCYPYKGDTTSVKEALYQHDRSDCVNFLKQYSNNDGTLNPAICDTEALSIYSSKRDISECRDAIEEMNGLSADLQKHLEDQQFYEGLIEDAEAALADLENDRFDELVAEGKILEVDCETCDEPVYREKPSMWSNVSQLLGLGLGAAAAYYTADKVSDKNARLGWPTNPYLGVQVGFPFVMAGIYGGILGGQSHGGYGCAGGIGGAGGGAFGYPPGMFGGPVSGGMYMPGMGPWGMPGPWSGWGQMGGGFLGGLAAMGGMMGGGYPGGMGGYPGMMGGGMPGGYMGNVAIAGGMGMPGMMGGGYPGMMGGGYPGGFGMAGGIGFLGGLGGGYPGMMGGGGYPGMMGGGVPGMMGNVGIAGGMGMPGMMGGGIPGMMGGGYPGMMGGGMYGGMPGMLAGGAGAGGLAGGNSAYLQMQMQMMEQQQRQMQIQMETQMRKAQQQQQAMQTITTLAQQIQQLQMQINTTYQGLFSDSYMGGGASFNSNTLVNGIQLNSNIPTRPGSHR